MRLSALVLTVALASTAACSASKFDGRNNCTLEAVGKVSRAGVLHATVFVPDHFMSGAEISNGGVFLLADNCDSALNASLSDETANYIIDNAPRRTLTSNAGTYRRIGASLAISRLADGSGEPWFFVKGVEEMHPITRPRTANERENYHLAVGS